MFEEKEKRHRKGSHKEKAWNNDGNKGRIPRDSGKETMFANSKPALTYTDSFKPASSVPTYLFSIFVCSVTICFIIKQFIR